MRRTLVLLAATLALIAVSAHDDADFEFTDADLQPWRASSAPERNSRRAPKYVYDPENELCSTIVCKKREVCVLAEGRPKCLLKRELSRRLQYSEVRVSDEEVAGSRCVGCGGTRTQFLCGSDNRTYSSLCRLDLHNCVRRPARPVALACRGFCPCVARSSPQQSRTNDVLPPEPRCQFIALADRLLDWFSVLMKEASAHAPSSLGFPVGCKPEVRWMFQHLDTDGDGRLSADNLYSLRHDDRERCLRPFLASCGGGGVSRAGWCSCLQRASRPCSALARAVRGRGARGGYVPSCTASGWYRPRQCHTALGVCWCVDEHGVERAGTRTRGHIRCARGEAPDDDEDAAGSGDREPDD